ncbi:MAG: ADP-ribosyltransferase [Candidatus Omnitrophota bacterium]
MVAIFLKSTFALKQFENGLVKSVLTEIDNGRGQVLQTLLENDPTGKLGRAQNKAVNAFKEASEKTISKIFQRMSDEVRNMLIEMGVAIGKFNAKEIDSLIDEAEGSIKKMKFMNRDDVSAILTELPIDGVKLDAWWDRQKHDLVESLERQVRKGLYQGETTTQLSKRILDSMEVEKRVAETLTRTAVTHVKATVDKETFEQNPDITEWYVYEAKLDNRTTPICRTLDGKKFRYDDPTAPKPPQHFNCRSRIRPVIKWEELGIEPPDIRRKSVGAKNEDGVRKRETVSEDIDYEAWLKRQPSVFQNEVLGQQRAEWFRAGKVGLADMLRSDGRLLTLDGLRAQLGLLSNSVALQFDRAEDLLAAEISAKNAAENATRRMNEALQYESFSTGNRAFAGKLKEGYNWATKSTKRWKRSLSKEEKDALIEYKAGSEKINEYLRKNKRVLNSLKNDKNLAKKVQDYIKSLNDAIKRSKVEKDITLYRGLNPESMGIKKKSYKGLIYTDPAFASSSLSKVTAETYGQNFTMEIRVNKGESGAWMEHQLKKEQVFSHDYEFLLPKGSKFRIIDDIVDKRSGARKWIVELL